MVFRAPASSSRPPRLVLCWSFLVPVASYTTRIRLIRYKIATLPCWVRSKHFSLTTTRVPVRHPICWTLLLQLQGKLSRPRTDILQPSSIPRLIRSEIFLTCQRRLVIPQCVVKRFLVPASTVELQLLTRVHRVVLGVAFRTTGNVTIFVYRADADVEFMAFPAAVAHMVSARPSPSPLPLSSPFPPPLLYPPSIDSCE